MNVPIKNIVDLVQRHAKATKTSKAKALQLAKMAVAMTPQHTKVYSDPLETREAIRAFASKHKGMKCTARELTGYLIENNENIKYDTVQNVLRSLSREKVVSVEKRLEYTGNRGRDPFVWVMVGE